MGTYKRVCIDANTTDKKELDAIFKILIEWEAEDCWQQFCESTKWWPDQLIEKLSAEFPKIIFRVDYEGEENSTHFIRDQAWVEEEFIWQRPKFPSVRKFNEGKDKKSKKTAAQKRRQKQIKQANANKLKRIAKLESEIESIEQELL